MSVKKIYKIFKEFNKADELVNREKTRKNSLKPQNQKQQTDSEEDITEIINKITKSRKKG